MPSQKIKTLDMKKYHREYMRKYYHKHREEFNEKRRIYYHKVQKPKREIKPRAPNKFYEKKLDIPSLQIKKGSFLVNFN